MSTDLRTRIQDYADTMLGSVTFRVVYDELQEILDETANEESHSSTLAQKIDGIKEDLEHLFRFEEHSGVSLLDLGDRLAEVSASLRGVGATEEASAEAATEPEPRPEPTLPPGVSAQPGLLDEGILNQAEVWKDRHGNLMWLDDMTEGHLRNVLAMLERKTASLHRLSVDKMLWLNFDPDIGMPLESVLDYPDAKTWMDQRPLIKRIREMLG